MTEMSVSHDSKKQSRLQLVRLTAEKRLKPVVVEIEKRMVKRFVEAVGYPNQLGDSEGNGVKVGRSNIMPPLMFCTPMMLGMPVDPELSGYFERGLFGNWSIRFFQDVHIGDVVTTSTKVTKVKERKGRLGMMVLIDYATEHRKENGQLVASSEGTIIHY